MCVISVVYACILSTPATHISQYYNQYLYSMKHELILMA